MFAERIVIPLKQLQPSSLATTVALKTVDFYYCISHLFCLLLLYTQFDYPFQHSGTKHIWCFGDQRVDKNMLLLQLKIIEEFDVIDRRERKNFTKTLLQIQTAQKGQFCQSQMFLCFSKDKQVEIQQTQAINRYAESYGDLASSKAS